MTLRGGDEALTRLRELFIESVDLPPDERTAFLAELTTREPAVAAKLAALFEADTHLTQVPTEPLLPQLRALRHASTHWIGGRIGAWTIRRELGAGGMGTVYLGEPVDANDRTRVAIKVLHADLVDAPSRRRFLLERDVLARLSHPLIARYVGAGEQDGALYAAMEYVDGAPILHYADRQRLNVRDRAALFLKVCAAIAHAHAHRVVHRDIKSSNILVTANGLPKLLDFGIAKPLQLMFGTHRVEHTVTAQRWFSPHSAAPEQITGGTIGVGTDVYGLGVLLYELLSGEPPFVLAGMTPGQIENTILGVEPDPPSLRALDGPPNVADARARLRGCADRDALAAALYGELDGVTLMALRKNADERYASVDEFAADLRNALKARPTEAGRTRRYARVVDAIRRHRVLAAGAAAALVLAAAAAWPERKPTPPVAVEPAPALDSPATATATADDPEAQLVRAIAHLEREQPTAAAALADRTLAAIDASDANADLRVRLYDVKIRALIRQADYVAARSAIDAGLTVATTPDQRTLLERRLAELRDARARSDIAPAASATTAAAKPESDCTAALSSEAGIDTKPETLQRFAQCVSHAGTSGDAAAKLALQVAYGRLLNRAGDYTGAAAVLDAALDDARADPALRKLDTHRVATLAAALAHYGADTSTANRERLRHELAADGWVAGDTERAQWREQTDLAQKLGVSARR